MKKILIGMLALCGFASLLYSHDLSQKNPETIFLTEKSLNDYRKFQSDVVEKHSLVIKKETHNKEEFYQELEKIEAMCEGDCEIITQKKLRKGKVSKSENTDLMNLETESYVSVLVLDNSDDVHKKILEYSEGSKYWVAGVSFAGIPYTNFLLDKYSLAIQEKLFPAMFVLGFIISLIFIGRLKNALVVYLPCIFSAGFSLATLKVLHGQMNMVTSIIPLVVFTVVLSLSFHLYFSLMELKNLKTVFKIKWAPIFLMMFTTYIGFLSLGWAEISAIRDFGLIAAQLVLFATIFAFIWYFLWEDYLFAPVEKEKKHFFSARLFAHSVKKWVIAVLAVSAILSIVFVPKKLEIITDATLYFPKDKQIREKIIAVTKTVSGMPIMEITIDLGHDLTLIDTRRMHNLELGIGTLKFSQPYKIISNNTLVAKANHEYSGILGLPVNIEGYFLLRGQLPSGLQESYPIEHKYRMSILGSPLNVKEYMNDLSIMTTYLNSQKVSYQVNGIHHNLMISQNAMIDVLASSFISSAIVIFIFSAFFLRSIKNNLIFIFVSLLPVALTFGVMYFLGYSINIATVMTFSISLGLVGDSSFHIIYAKKTRFKDFEEYNRGVLSPVVGSGLLLCVCFGMFTLNTFMPIRQFGGILAIIMFLGTLIDLYVLPTLLYGTSNHKRAYESPD